MKNRQIIVMLFSILTIGMLVSCSSGPTKENNTNSSKPTSMVESWEMKQYIKGDLPAIDEAMVKAGEAEFGKICVACHKFDQKLIGPALKGVTQKRSANWLMNILLHNEEMVKNDPDAKALFAEFNNTAMSTAGLDETKARAILEYLRAQDAK
ncbi:MAG: cytochrome c [Saprospiraceae bacterium]|jgi:cytochrome c|nr:cytochrome c [Saprospiraceae bacterium]